MYFAADVSTGYSSTIQTQVGARGRLWIPLLCVHTSKRNVISGAGYDNYFDVSIGLRNWLVCAGGYSASRERCWTDAQTGRMESASRIRWEQGDVAQKAFKQVRLCKHHISHGRKRCLAAPTGEDWPNGALWRREILIQLRLMGVK